MQIPRFLALFLVLGSAAVAQERLAAPVEDVLSRLAKYHNEGKPREQRVAFEIPDVLVNAYLAVALKVRPRPGIESAAIKVLEGNRVSAEGRLNLDAIKPRPKGIPAELKGSQPVALEVQFQAGDGAVKITCEKFLLAGSALPQPVAAELIRVVGSMQPEKFDSSRPIPLPFGLTRLSTAGGAIRGDTGR